MNTHNPEAQLLCFLLWIRGLRLWLLIGFLYTHTHTHSWSGFYTHTHTRSLLVFLIYFFIYIYITWECPGQLMHTTTNSRIHWTTYKPSVHVKHCEGDRHVKRELNPDTEKGNKSLIYSSLWVWYLKVMLIFVIMILKNKFNDIHANYSIY